MCIIYTCLYIDNIYIVLYNIYSIYMYTYVVYMCIIVECLYCINYLYKDLILEVNISMCVCKKDDMQ